SQTGPFTPMPHGSLPAEFQNDASTTQSTNERRISSGDMGPGNQHDSGPNLYLYEERRSAGGSEIQDTQGRPSPAWNYRRRFDSTRMSESFGLIVESGDPPFSQGSVGAIASNPPSQPSHTGRPSSSQGQSQEKPSASQPHPQIPHLDTR